MLQKFKLLFLTITAMGLISCATPYREKSTFGGGYTDIRIDHNTAKVSFEGNTLTSKDTVQTYMLYRAAELTSQYGFDYFIITYSRTRPHIETFTTPGEYVEKTVTKKQHGKYVDSTVGYYQPGETHTSKYYSSSAQIKMFNGQKPNRPDAYNAQELLTYMSSKIKR